MEKSEDYGLTPRFEEALIYAARLHAGQNRKGNRVPYVAHLLGVTSLVLEDGGDEDQAIAALLHDAVEDQGGLETLKEIRSRFGDRVAEIVAGCTDAFVTPKPPWADRKKAYLEHLPEKPGDIRRVSLADKLYNARAILANLHQEQERTWQHFRGGKQGTLWYFRSLADLFLESGDDFMAVELANTVDRMEALASRA
jgi:(p)ppGpp synthase/HD superfamily hydrolase